MDLNPSPHPSQPKSDLSDFGHLKVPSSGKPEFGCEERGEGAHRVSGTIGELLARYLVRDRRPSSVVCCPSSVAQCPSASAISPSEPTMTRHQANNANPWRCT